MIKGRMFTRNRMRFGRLSIVACLAVLAGVIKVVMVYAGR